MLVDINLLAEKERGRPVFILSAISLILLGFIVGLVFYFVGNSYENRQQILAVKSADIVSQQASIQDKLLQSEALSDTQQLQKTVEWAETYQYDTLPLIRKLTSLLPERGFFMNFSFSSPSEALINVQFDTSREAAFYLTQLKSSEMITSVNLSTLSYQPLAEVSANQTEGATTEVESISSVMPRYVASYAISFIDTRMPADGTAVPIDPNVPPVEGEPSPTEPQPPADDAQGVETNE